MTDGVEDYNNGSARLTNIFDASACARLKAPVAQNGMGAGVFVLQAADESNFITTATDNYGNPLRNTDGSQWTSDETFNASVAAMKACATDPTYYFLASSPADIQAATQKIINLALSRPTVLTGLPNTPGTTGN